MSYPDPPQQPQWQPPQQPGQAYPPPQGPGGGGPQHPGFAAPQGPGPYAGGPGAPMGPGGPGAPMGPGGPGAPMGPGGPGAPMGPGQPPYGGHFQGAPVPPPEGGGRRRKWLIPTAAGVAVVLMGGTVWAAMSLADFKGPQPESVLPGNSAAFAKVDLDINGSQAVDLLRFVDKLPDEISDEIGEFDEDDTESPFAELFSDTYDLDQASVEEWIGQKAGVAAWNTDDQNAGDSDGMAFAIALGVEDTGAADAQFNELRESHDVHHRLVDDFVVFTDSEAALADYDEQMSINGDLESDETFKGDVDTTPKGSIALAWADLGAMPDSADLGNELAPELGADASVSGRMTASFRVDNDYLEARMDVLGLEVEGADTDWLAVGSGGSLEAMGGLPGDSVMAFGGSGLDEMLSLAWENDEFPGLDADERREMESDMASVGAPLPEGFTSLVGTSSAFGVADLDMNSLVGSYGSSEPSFIFRAVGADEDVWNELLGDVSSPYSTAPTVGSDGDAVTLSNGSIGGGTLAEDQVFQQTMAGMDDAVIAGFVDLRQLTSGQVSAPDQWGAVGMGMTVADGGEHIMVELRWAPSGG